MAEDRIEMSQRERDVLKVMAPVLKGKRTQAEAARLRERSVRQVRRIQRRLAADGGPVKGVRKEWHCRGYWSGMGGGGVSCARTASVGRRWGQSMDGSSGIFLAGASSNSRSIFQRAPSLALVPA